MDAERGRLVVGSMMRAARALALLLPLCSCHVLGSLEDCSSDKECTLGQWCNPSGRFCEQDPGPVRIGACLGLSGAVASAAEAQRKAIEFAVSHINSQGGILGRPIAVEIIDDESDPGQAVACVRTHIDRRVAAILGPLRSTQAVETEKLAQQSGILEVTSLAGASALATNLPKGDRYFFQTVTSIRRGTASAIVKHARDSGCTKMAILYQEDVTDVDYKDSIDDLFPRNGGCVLTKISLSADVKPDYVAEVDKLVDSKAKCAAVLAVPKVIATVMGEYNARAGLEPMLFLSHTIGHQQALLDIKAVNNECVAKDLQGGDINPSPPTSNYATIRALYNAHFQLTPSEGQPEPELAPFAANTYDAVALIALAIQHAGAVTDRVAIRDGLRAVANYEPGKNTYAAADFGEAMRALRRGEPINYDGASGSIEFDDYGVVANGTVIWSVKDCAFQNLKVYSEAEMVAVGEASGFCSP